MSIHIAESSPSPPAYGKEERSLGRRPLRCKVSDFQDVEVKETITTTLAILEPAAILIMAVIVGAIVIALFLPLTMIGDMVG